MDDSPVLVHVWMSLYDWVCMRGCGWQVTANPIVDSLQKTISDLHRGRGGLGTIANKVSEICKAAGALVTENDRLWRVAHALTRLREESYSAVAWTSPTIRAGATERSRRR